MMRFIFLLLILLISGKSEGRLCFILLRARRSFTVEDLSDRELGLAEIGCVFAPLNHRYPYASTFYSGLNLN